MPIRRRLQRGYRIPARAGLSGARNARSATSPTPWLWVHQGGRPRQRTRSRGVSGSKCRKLALCRLGLPRGCQALRRQPESPSGTALTRKRKLLQARAAGDWEQCSHRVCRVHNVLAKHKSLGTAHKRSAKATDVRECNKTDAHSAHGCGCGCCGMPPIAPGPEGTTGPISSSDGMAKRR